MRYFCELKLYGFGGLIEIDTADGDYVIGLDCVIGEFVTVWDCGIGL